MDINKLISKQLEQISEPQQDYIPPALTEESANRRVRRLFSYLGHPAIETSIAASD